MPRGLAALMVVLPALAGASEGNLWAGGTYRGAELGLLEFRTEGGRVSGKYQGGGACPGFQVDQQIIEGQFEGNVLVGSVMLCQSGAACKQRTYRLLAFLSSLDGSLSGEVKLDGGCASPALKGTRLSLEPVTAEERGSAKMVNGSASQVAKKKGSAKKNGELAAAAALAGRRLITSGDYAGAAEQFEVAISYNDRNWTAYLGLGVAEFKRGNVLRAIEAYERARDLSQEANVENADIFYNLACAHGRRGDRKAALANLRQAVKLGFSLADKMNADADLNRALRDEPEFKKLVSQARTQSKGGRRGEKSF